MTFTHLNGSVYNQVHSQEPNNNNISFQAYKDRTALRQREREREMEKAQYNFPGTFNSCRRSRLSQKHDKHAGIPQLLRGYGLELGRRGCHLICQSIDRTPTPGSERSLPSV